VFAHTIIKCWVRSSGRTCTNYDSSPDALEIIGEAFRTRNSLSTDEHVNLTRVFCSRIMWEIQFSVFEPSGLVPVTKPALVQS
jgi:hypothetical protein